MTTGTFHQIARAIDECIMSRRAIFEKYVILDSVKDEFFKALLESNTVIAGIITTMMQEGKKFHPREFFYAAKHDGMYRQHRDIMDLFSRWLRIQEDDDPGFNSYDSNAIIKESIKMHGIIRRHFNSTFSGDRTIFYSPTVDEITAIKQKVNLNGLSEHRNQDHVYEACCFAFKHDSLVKHDYFFLTFDKGLENRAVNYTSRLGRLAIMYYSRFMDLYGLHHGPESLLHG